MTGTTEQAPTSSVTGLPTDSVATEETSAIAQSDLAEPLLADLNEVAVEASLNDDPNQVQGPVARPRPAWSPYRRARSRAGTAMPKRPIRCAPT